MSDVVVSEVSRKLLSKLLVMYGFEPLVVDERKDQLRVLGRLQADGRSVGDWLLFRQYMLAFSADKPWKYECCKLDVLKGGRLAWGYRLIFAHDPFSACVDDVLEQMALVPRGSVKEHVAVLRAPHESVRQVFKGGKGVSTIGQSGSGMPEILRRKFGQ